jgi:hypothetical protein
MEQRLKFFREKSPKTHKYTGWIVVLFGSRYITTFNRKQWVCKVVMTNPSRYLGLRFFKKTRNGKLRLGTPIVWVY